MTPRTTLTLLAMAAAPRLILFPFAENVAGDAVVRSWLAHAWAQHPHFIGASSQGCLQFGPLHLVLVGMTEWLVGSEFHAGRVLSLLAGVLSVLPLFALTKRLFSERAGYFAAAVFSLWPLHLQASTTAASEALNVALVLLGVALIAKGLDARDRPSMLLGGLMITLACAVRYDVWPWVGLLTLVVWWKGSFRRAVAFGLVAGSFPVAWLFGHLVDTGDLLAPIRLIDDYHRSWFVSESAIWGPVTYRFIVLFFWPLTALVTFTPFLFVVGGGSLLRSRTRNVRWLVVLLLVSMALLSLRGAVLGSFVPLARFTMKELSLFCVFIGAGLAEFAVIREWSVQLLATLAIWNPLLELGARSAWKWSNSFRAVSPLSLNDLSLRDCLAVFHDSVQPTDVVAIDVDPRGFDDLQFAFESRLPQRQVARRRAPSFEERTRTPPRWLVLFEGGVLREADFTGSWREAARSGNVRLLVRTE